jgi:hypothetical protein
LAVKFLIPFFVLVTFLSASGVIQEVIKLLGSLPANSTHMQMRNKGSQTLAGYRIQRYVPVLFLAFGNSFREFRSTERGNSSIPNVPPDKPQIFECSTVTTDSSKHFRSNIIEKSVQTVRLSFRAVSDELNKD